MNDQHNNDNQKGNGNPSRDNNGQDSRETNLLKLQQQALSMLLPMVDKLDEPPARKFEILMTAARSSDDPALLGKTLETAQQIEGDSEKANAILDVLNEVNYHLRSG